MAITAEVRKDILELLVLMFDAAPGATYLSDITAIYESISGTHAQKMQGVAYTLSNTGVFQSEHPNFQTVGEFATDFLSTLGLENNAEARAWVTANFGNGSPAAKAQIMYAGWNFLNSYSGSDPAYLKAQAIMNNKASVSEYYSVTLGEAALDLATLQDVIADVDETAESVAEAKEEIEDEAAELQVLTPGNDIIDVLGNAPITIEGIVDGDGDGGGGDDRSNATFNPGDNINGNGATEVNLVVVDGGDAGFMRLTEIEQVNIEAGTNEAIFFNAAGWTGVGEVLLNDGVDGMAIFLDNLEAGTTIGVSNVQGAIAAEYDTDEGNVTVNVGNGNEGGEGVTAVATAEGDITVEGSDSVSVDIFNATGVTLGDISVTVADSSSVSIWFDDTIGFDGEVVVGNIAVAMGNEGWFGLGNASGIDGDQTYGNVTATVGDEAGVGIYFEDNTDGELTVGNIDVEMGATGDFTLSVTSNDSVEITFGDVSVVAGDESELDINVANNDNGDITFGDINLEGGLASNINVTFDGYGEDALTVGNVTLTAGDATTGDGGEDSYVNLEVQSFSAVDFGDISLVAGTDGFVDVSFTYISGDLDIGNVSLEAEDGAQMTVYEATGDVVVGNIDIMSEGNSFAWIAKSGMGMGEDEDGSVTVGDVTITGGASGYASFDVQDYNQVTVGNVEIVGGAMATLEIEAEGNLGNITLGNASVSATGESGWASITLTNDSNANAGNITAGNLSAVANGDNGAVNIGVFNDAWTVTTEDNTGTSVGDVTIGDITASVGAEIDVYGEDGQDGVDANIDIHNDAMFWSAGEDNMAASAGNLTVGDVEVTLGNGFVSGTLTNDSVGVVHLANWGAGGVGDFVAGDITVTGGDFMAAWISVSNYAHTTGATVGDMTVGNVTVEGGESANVYFDAMQALHGSAGEMGAMTIGNFDIAVGQDSVVDISVTRSISNADATLGTNVLGDLTVGDMDIVMGDNAEVNVYIASSVSYDSAEGAEDGDFTVGDISVAVSATESEDLSGNSDINVVIARSSWNDDAGEQEGGDFTVGDITLSAAGNMANVDVQVVNTGSWDVMGDTEIGMIDVTIANGGQAGEVEGEDAIAADVEISVTIGNFTTGSIGNVTLGGVGLHMGNNAQAVVNVTIDDHGYAGDIGDVDLGDWMVEIGDDSLVQVYVSISQDDLGDDIGNLTLGDVTVVAGDDSEVSMSTMDVSVVGDIGNVTFGDFDVTLGDDSSIWFSPSVSATGDIGDITLGSITANLGEGAYLSYSAEFGGDDGVGDITLGDITVNADAGANVDYLIVSVTATEGSLGAVSVGNIDIDLEAGAQMSDSAYLWFSAQNDIGGTTVGDVSIEASDGSMAHFSITATAEEGQAGDMLVGDITLSAMDEGLTIDVGTEEVPDEHELGAEVVLNINNWGETGDNLTVGNVTITVEGNNTDVAEGPADSVQLFLGSAGDVTIGNVTVSGSGLFILDGEDHSATPGASFIAVSAGDDITIGDIDFSGYENDISLDLSWTQAGALNITAGEGDDTVLGNAGNNRITGSDGADLINISQGGVDTVVTSDGESGVTQTTIDTITGFGSTDKLDFNTVAGTAGNYVEDSDGVSNFATFITDAAANLNTTVRFYAAYNAGADQTWVAVNYGSGEADMVVALTGNQISTLTFANFVA